MDFNRVFNDGSQPRSYRITSVFFTRNQAPIFLAEYGFNNFARLVEVPLSFGRLAEILGLDNGLRPHFLEFEVRPDFGLGDIIHPPPSYYIHVE